jgi:hypothetical protein
MRSTITAQPGLHSLYSTGSGGATVLAAGFATGFTAARFTARFTGRARRLEERVVRVRVARMCVASSQPVDSASRILRCLSFYPGRSRSGSRPVQKTLSVSRFKF